jgi:GH15 family glucan-1,4-alpha-glucosidase
MPSPIEDYALIGDCFTAGLVGQDGSIDWLCFPRFDSAACFAALLGTPEHGRWLLAPQGGARATRRRYRDGTMILQSDFDTPEGSVTVTDFMPVRDRAPDLVRIVEGRSGRVPMAMELVIRTDYGSIVPWVYRIEDGIAAVAGPDRLLLRSAVPLHNENFRTHASFQVDAGERAVFTLTWHPSYEPPPPAADPLETLRRSEEWWKAWADRCTYYGPWREQVLRSLITLKALTYAPTGGILAAATTSLPEQLGGPRNWDYRFCWLRDATFTLFALMSCGYREEARDWRRWLVRAVAGHPAATNIMYGLAGERRLTELELTWLPGYEHSTPVRIGNAACKQFQLDIYGEALDAMYQARTFGLEPEEEGWSIERALVGYVEEAYDKPDEGIWEVRGPRRHFVHSKVMAWVALDRAVKAMEKFGVEGPDERWRELRDQVYEEICRRGFDPELGTFVQYYGSKELDASLLLIPLVGFLPATDLRMKGTIEAIEKHLLRDGFVCRYSTHEAIDGLPPGEGAFLACTFWLADCQFLMGRKEEARRTFERLLRLGNDVGLLSEEYDVKAGRLIGNFPQAFSHVGLVNTALNLSPTHPEGPAEQRPQT